MEGFSQKIRQSDDNNWANVKIQTVNSEMF